MLFLHLFSQIFCSSDKFFMNFCKNSRVVGIHNICGISVGVGLPVGVSNVVVKGLPSAVDVCDAPIVSGAVHQTVANIPVLSSAAVAGVPAECCLLSYCLILVVLLLLTFMMCLLSLLLLSSLMLMVSLL